MKFAQATCTTGQIDESIILAICIAAQQSVKIIDPVIGTEEICTLIQNKFRTQCVSGLCVL